MTPAEVDELKRLTQLFKDELAALGVNMKDVQNKLDALTKRVSAIEDELSKMIKFRGDLFFGTRSTQSRYGFLDYSGGLVGRQSSLFDNIQTPHDFHLEARANLPNGLKFYGDLVSTNYLSYRANSFNASGQTVLNGGLNNDTFLYEANIVIPVGATLLKRNPNESIAPATHLTVGRYREKVSPLTMWRVDYDKYFDLPWYDDGSYIQDGFEFKTIYSGATSKIFGGSYSSVVGSAGNPFNSPMTGSPLQVAHPNPLFLAGAFGAGIITPGALTGGFGTFAGLGTYGQMQAGQVIGGHIAIPIFKVAEVGFTLIDFSSTSNGIDGSGGFAGGYGVPGSNIGNVVVYGADAKLKDFGRLSVSAEASKSVTQRTFTNGDGRNNEDNNAYQLNLAYNSGGIMASGGYQYIDPRYSAPGYWNKIGSWYNPTNVQGPFVKVAYNFSDKLKAHIGGDWLTGARNRPILGGFTPGSSALKGEAGVKYQITKGFSLGADYEGVFYDLSPSITASGRRGKPIEQFITFAAGVNLFPGTDLKLGYQILNLQDVGGGFGIGNVIPGGNVNASVFTTQVAVHF